MGGVIVEVGAINVGRGGGGSVFTSSTFAWMTSGEVPNSNM